MAKKSKEYQPLDYGQVWGDDLPQGLALQCAHQKCRFSWRAKDINEPCPLCKSKDTVVVDEAL